METRYWVRMPKEVSRWMVEAGSVLHLLSEFSQWLEGMAGHFDLLSTGWASSVRNEEPTKQNEATHKPVYGSGCDPAQRWTEIF